MEKDNKRKATPDINKELMMNLMVDGIKKKGLQFSSKLNEEPIKPHTKDTELPKEKPAVKEKSRTKRISEADY